jgi:hypothetical protein
MEIKTIPNYYFVQQMPNHERVKEVLLEEFTKTDFEPVYRDGEQISIADWHLSMHPRNWVQAFRTLYNPLLQEVADKLYADNVQTNGFWFQQYFNSDYHGWHVHGHTNWSSIYLVECPEGMETEFFDVTTGSILEDMTLKEGDIITFPANMLHRSKPNTTNQRKTIVSWNSNFTSNHENNVLKALGLPPMGGDMPESFDEDREVTFD